MKILSRQKGMTLIEVMVAIGILGLIMIAVSSFQRDVLVYNKYSEDSLSSAQDARVILRTIVKELRSASPSNNGAYAIAQAATNTITFFSDVDSDGLKEQIRYFISGTNLKKGFIKPSGSPITYNPANETFVTLVYNIRTSTSTALFEYFDSSYTGTSTPLTLPIVVTQIHLVKINIIIDANPNRAPAQRVYTSQVNLRNLKDNL